MTDQSLNTTEIQCIAIQHGSGPSESNTAQNMARCFQTPRCFYITKYTSLTLNIAKAYLRVIKSIKLCLTTSPRVHVGQKNRIFKFHEENRSEKNAKNIVTLRICFHEDYLNN